MLLWLPLPIQSVLRSLVALASPMQMKAMQNVRAVQRSTRNGCLLRFIHRIHNCDNITNIFSTASWPSSKRLVTSLTCVPVIFNRPRLLYFVVKREGEVREIGSKDVISVYVDGRLAASSACRVEGGPVCICEKKISTSRTYILWRGK